jgi:hypothetical protein
MKQDHLPCQENSIAMIKKKKRVSLDKEREGTISSQIIPDDSEDYKHLSLIWPATRNITGTMN